MRLTRSTLDGRRGWSAVVGLSTVLAVLVGGQLSASADSLPVAPAGAAVLAPTYGPSAPAVVPELLPVTAPTDPDPVAAQPAVVAPVKPAAKPAAAKPAAKAPVAKKPVAKKPAAKQPAASLCSGSGWQERRGRAALASLRPGAATRTGFRIEFKGARSGYMGLTHLQQHRIEMFVRGCGVQSGELLRHVMAHELGHAYDTVKMSAASRRAYQLARGIPLSTPWYGCSGCSDFATPAGDFAETYAQWARGASTNRSQLAGDVPPAQLAALAQRFFGA